jgi:hypothetical protein
MSTTPTPRPKLSASERIQLIQNQANQPIVCAKCGSNWFTDVSFQQYSGSRYSSTPGGDIQVISSLLHRIRVCICGHPYAPNLGGVRPGRTAASEVSSFMESFNAAKAYLESIGKLDPEVIAVDFPTRDDFQKLTEQVETLEKKIAGSAKAAPAPEPQPELAAEGIAEEASPNAPRRPGRPPKNPTVGGADGK